MTMSGQHGQPVDQSLPRPGDLIVGKYRIEKLIGKGGMGAVFSAQHELLGQRVAVKFLLGDIVTNQEAVQRFLNEARNAAKIQSEHVCRVQDVGTSEAGLPYMVLEFLEGLDLSQRLEQHGPLTVEEAVDYILQALEAIAQAHQLGIVHRDLKPANLYLCRRSDGSATVKVLDFGIAKASNPFGEGGNHSLTSTKSMLGSPLYMSPEQLRSAKNVDARADIWALGVILYELLTGTVPFNGETLGELFIAILEQPPVPVFHKRQDVPQALNDAIQRCLSRAVEQRFQNVAELAQAIASCAPARSFASVERITSTLGMPRPSMVMPQPGVGGYGNPQAQTGSGGYRLPSPSYVDTGSGGQQVPPQGVATNPGQTNASWGNTAGGEQKSKAPLFAGLGLGALVLVGVLVFAGIKLGGHKANAGGSDSATAATTTATATATTTAATTTTAAASATADTTAATATAATATAAQTAPQNTGSHAAPTGKPTGAGAPTGKPSATAATTTTAAQPTATAKPTATATGTSTAFNPFGGR